MAITTATISDVQSFEPDILDFGIPDFDEEITKAQNDVFRDLRIRWWPTQQIGLYDLRRLASGQIEPDEDLYTASQLTRATVYNALGFHVYPKLAKFEPDQDLFERKMEFYRKEYERELDLVLRDGVEYDADSSGAVTDTEKEPQHFLRLKRQQGMSNRETITKDIIEVLKDMNPPRPTFVSREPFDVDKLAMTQFPALLVTTGNETREDQAMGGYRRGIIEVTIRGFVRSDGRKNFVQSVDEKRNALIERIEEALNTNRDRELATARAATTHVTSIEVIDRTPPLGEFVVIAEVHYSFTKGAV